MKQVMKKQQTEFTSVLAQGILTALCTAPTEMLDPFFVKRACIVRDNPETTLVDLYDFFDNIATTTGFKSSPFVKDLCNVTKYYVRPK